MGGDESKIHVVCGNIQKSFFVAAKYTPEGDGLAGEGWISEAEEIQADVRVVFSTHP